MSRSFFDRVFFYSSILGFLVVLIAGIGLFLDYSFGTHSSFLFPLIMGVGTGIPLGLGLSIFTGDTRFFTVLFFPLSLVFWFA